MERRVINPWTWQERYGFSHAIEVRGAERILFCAGQGSIDADGVPLHPGDMGRQLVQALDNLETVLREAGYTLSDVVRLDYFTTDVDAFITSFDETIKGRLAEAGAYPPGVLAEVARLGPGFLVEIEATAVR